MITGAHRKVSCHCGLSTVARQVLVDDINMRLPELFEPGPNGRPIIENILIEHPDLRIRLKEALKL